MAQTAEHGDGRVLNLLRFLGWGGVAAFLLFPLIAMQFSDEVNWTGSDFAVAAVLFGGSGIAMELAVRTSRSLAYRWAAGLAIAASAGLFLVTGAVGFLGGEDNPANLVFLGVIALAVVGSIVTGARPAGMSLVMFAAAAAQILIGLVAIPAGWSSPGADGLYEVALGTTMFGAMWLVSAGLFRKAAHEQKSTS